jgi:hypothetical protein
LEPIFKVLFCLLGVFIELYVGFRGWRPLYKAEGHFAEFHANNWQVRGAVASFWHVVKWMQQHQWVCMAQLCAAALSSVQ